jgi:valyl-tRNA synthetase
LIELDLSAGVDVAATRTRLDRERQAAEKERDQNAAKLANPAFTDKAPEPVIAKVRERVAVAEADLARIDAALRALGDQ